MRARSEELVEKRNAPEAWSLMINRSVEPALPI
jgi:hypothetical protein